MIRFFFTLILMMQSEIVHAQLPQAKKVEGLDQFIVQKMSDVGVVGLAAALIVNREVVWMRGYGFADYKRSRPFTPDTVMNVASIAKTFTGVAMMRAVGEGKLSLDENINKYLPFQVFNPNHPNEKITLRQLATHTSSIVDRWEVYSRAYLFGDDPREPLGHFLENYFKIDGKNYSIKNFSQEKPGRVRVYSNIGAAIAGFIIERAVGESLNSYTRKHIFGPIGMINTGWFLSEVNRDNHTTHFVAQNGFSIPIPHFGYVTYPDGEIRTSVSDLSKFFITLLNDGKFNGSIILEESMAKEMQRFQFTDQNRPQNFQARDGNSGLFWRTKFGGTRVGHGGNDPGIQAEMLSDIEKEVGVILFMNTSVGVEGQKTTSAIFEELWKHAGSLRDKKP